MNKKSVFFGLPVIVLLIIYFPLFYTNYVYLDDCHYIWHNEKGIIYYDIWLVQGRFLGGLLMEKAYTSIHAISAIKILRIVSLSGWALAICLFIKCINQWARYINFDSRLILLSGVYIACSISVSIYTGWGATCFEIFLAFIAGLLSGHLLFTQLKKCGTYVSIPVPMQLLILTLGVCSLFLYQIGIGAFLLPFFLHFTTKKFRLPDHIVITGVIAYLVIVLVYYLLFKLSLNIEGVTGSDRTALNLNVFDKIAFFFSVPTAQAFSFNFFLNLHSIISQAFYIITISVWIAYLFISYRNQPVIKKLLYVVVVFLLMMLMYLPVMVARENFASYRTMINLNLAAFILLTSMILEWIKKEKWKNYFVITAMGVLIITGFYNFRYNFLYPVAKEYKLLRTYVQQQYTAGLNKVYFLRPPENLFYKEFQVHPYRDEFGVPSTFRDWVPEPLVKQIIFELTGSKSIAEKIEVVQFTEAASFNKQVEQKEDHTLAIDMAAIFYAGEK